MAFVIGLKYKSVEKVLAVLDEETPVVIKQNNGNDNNNSLASENMLLFKSQKSKVV